MKMRHVEAFRDVWNQIESGVKAALEHQSEGLMAGDVFASLKSKEALLFMDGESFFIVKKITNALGEKALLCWIAFGADIAAESAVARYQPDIVEIAKREGCSEIHFVSTRRGYDRLMPPLGWRMLHTRYRLRLLESHEGESR